MNMKEKRTQMVERFNCWKKSLSEWLNERKKKVIMDIFWKRKDAKRREKEIQRKDIETEIREDEIKCIDTYLRQ